MTESPPIVQLQDVAMTYGGAQAANILDGVSLEVRAGRTLSVVGVSGSGKSTLLNIIGTLDRPTRGRVLIGGKDVSGMDDEALAELRRRQIGFVFQLHHLLPQCTAIENVLVPAMAGGGAVSADTEARAQHLLDLVELADRADHRPGQLSGGERQRVALARALINGPKLLLADEPTGSVDRASSRRIADMLLRLNQAEGVTLIVVTHDHDLARRMRTVLELRQGRLFSEEASP